MYSTKMAHRSDSDFWPALRETNTTRRCWKETGNDAGAGKNKQCDVELPSSPAWLQEPVLFDVSLEENVKYGFPEATEKQVLEAARAAHMDYAFSGAVKWSDRVGLRGEKLSGGQKQRCALARALLRKPEFMPLGLEQSPA